MKAWELKTYNILKGTPFFSVIRRYRYNRQLYDKHKAESVLNYFRPDISDEKRKMLLADMLNTAKQYRFTFEEFFLYDFEGKTLKERLEFVPDLERIDIVESLNKAKNQYIFDDKRETYKCYSVYYKRDCLVSEGGGTKTVSIFREK